MAEAKNGSERLSTDEVVKIFGDFATILTLGPSMDSRREPQLRSPRIAELLWHVLERDGELPSPIEKGEVPESRTHFYRAPEGKVLILKGKEPFFNHHAAFLDTRYGGVPRTAPPVTKLRVERYEKETWRRHKSFEQVLDCQDVWHESEGRVDEFSGDLIMLDDAHGIMWVVNSETGERATPDISPSNHEYPTHFEVTEQVTAPVLTK